MSTNFQELKAGIETALKNCGANAPGGGGFQEGNTCAGEGDGKESEWSEEGKPASPAAANKLLEKAGIHTSSKVAAQYNHRGEMAGGGGGTSKGVTIKKAGSSTRLSYSFGMGSHYSEYDRTKATNQLNSAREVLHKAGYQTRPLSYLKDTYEVQKKPSNKSLGESMPTKSMEEIFDDKLEVKGGRGSGNFGHSGRPGEQGGSGDGGGTKQDMEDKWQQAKLHSWEGILKKTGNDEGQAYVIRDTLMRIKAGSDPDQAFHDAAENENLYGHRADIVKDREAIADLLSKHFNVKVSDPVNTPHEAKLLAKKFNYPEYDKGPREKFDRIMASKKKSFSELKSDITSRFEELEEEAALKSDMTSSIAQLEVSLDIAETNAPINEREGNLEQAAAERVHAESFREALKLLRAGKSLPDDLASMVAVGLKALKAKSDEGRWVTIRGARVFVRDDGKIIKGPKKLLGNTEKEELNRGKATNWMRLNADSYETSTELAEAAADQFDLYDKDRDKTIPEWVFEQSAKVKPTE